MKTLPLIEDSAQYLIPASATIKTALERLNNLSNVTLFALNDHDVLVGSISDGDIRRALVKGISLDGSLKPVINKNFVYFKKGCYSPSDVNRIREKKIKLIPLIDEKGKLIRVINLEYQKAVLPIDAVIMAGGEGRRLRPLTEHVPKPLLEIAGKPIIEYNIETLAKYGVENCFITIKYLGHKIREYLGNGNGTHLKIKYIKETEKALGTIGAVTLIDDFEHDYVLVMNSDLLTNIDLENFFITFEEHDADMSVATIPYHVTIPYAVLETNDQVIMGLKEKPTYTYHSNAGIYLFKRQVFDIIPKGTFYNATDLMDSLINSGRKVTTFPLYCYWLDIGNPEDFEKAQKDIHHIKF